MRRNLSVSKPRILDVDIENRPLAYLGNDYTTAEITAIAVCWVDDPSSIWCWLLGRDPAVMMLFEFRGLYEQADMVTGHYIRKHDLPILNGAMMEAGFQPLPEKLTSDTKLDLVKRKDLSASQENLSAMLGIPEGKAHMSNAMWREANRLTPEGLKLTAQRAMGDVLQHMAMRKKLIERNLLGPPRMWRP
jgi:hypothetical protein